MKEAKTAVKTRFSHNNKPNRHYAYDAGQAIAQFTIEAVSRGLYLHQMAGFDLQKAMKIFNLPEEVEPLTCIAMGYLGDPKSLPSDLEKTEVAPRERKPLKALFLSLPFIKIPGD